MNQANKKQIDERKTTCSWIAHQKRRNFELFLHYLAYIPNLYVISEDKLSFDSSVVKCHSFKWFQPGKRTLFMNEVLEFIKFEWP